MKQMQMWKDDRVDVSPSLLRSAFQKNVRRCRVGPAVRTLAAHDRKDALWRLPIVVMEEALLPEWYDELMAEPEMGKIVRWGGMIAAIQVRDAHRGGEWGEIVQDEDEFWARALSLPDKPYDLVWALMQRSRYGGMKSDVEMLRDYAALWLSRFEADAEAWMDRIRGFYDEVEVEIEPLQPGDIPIQAVDMHCSPIVHVLAKKGYIREKVEELWEPEADVKRKIGGAMWCFWSSVNVKTDFRKGRRWYFCKDRRSKEEGEKLAELWNVMEQETISVARWWLRKKGL